MKHLRPILVIAGMVMLLSAVAHANAGPPIVLAFSFHLMFVTWIIGFGEGLLLSALFRTWKSRMFNSMIAANFASAFFGMWFVKSTIAARIMGDLTIENLASAFWTIVYVTFVLTMIIEFPFFIYALYGRKRLVPKAVAVTLLAHCIGYTLIFSFYDGENSMSMVSQIDVVPASTFEMAEDYDLYYISSDGKQVLRSDLAGNGTEVITTLNMEGEPERLCACPRKVIDETPEGAEKRGEKTIQHICWDGGFDLCVIVNVNGVNETSVLLENFSPRAAIDLQDDKYTGLCEEKDPGWPNVGDFRSFGDAKNWYFRSEYWGYLEVRRVVEGYSSYSSILYEGGSQAPEIFEEGSYVDYWVHTPFVQWTVENGSHIAGDYAVFTLGKDQICILDPEKKRIALIARGFGPVVAKPPLDNAEALPAAPEEVPQESIQTNEPTPEETPQNRAQTNEATSQKMEVLFPPVRLPYPFEN